MANDSSKPHKLSRLCTGLLVRIGQGRVGEGSVLGEKEIKDRGEGQKTENCQSLPASLDVLGVRQICFRSLPAVIPLPVGLSTLIQSSECPLFKMDSAGLSISYTPAHETESGERVKRVKIAKDGNAVSQNAVAEARLRSVLVEVRGVIIWSRSQDGRCNGMDEKWRSVGMGL